MTSLQGIAASGGIAIAKAYRLVEPDLSFTKTKVVSVDAEIKKFDEAIITSIAELKNIQKTAQLELGAGEAAIFDAHILVLNDPELIVPIKEKIFLEKVNAEYAVKEVASMFVEMFEKIDNDYMRARATDIRDVMKRLLAHLLGIQMMGPHTITEKVIVIAKDLTPSDTVQLNREYVLAFATDIGGSTSHSSIMARTMEIPAIVGIGVATEEIEDGDLVIIDGLSGKLHINPTAELLAEYEVKLETYETQKAEWATLVNEQTITADGKVVQLAANIGTLNDLQSVVTNGGEAVGLYRTEFLYMEANQLPTEEVQFQAYQKVLREMGDKPVVIRTLDIGGDKELPYLQQAAEQNPFLGVRAIRLSLAEQAIFRTQLRALLRASVFGNLKMMFPMIATLDEFRQAKAIVMEEKEALKADGIRVSDAIEIGIMVEVPSTAILADQFAEEVDFFSIGTNDLIQYTMAADRMNKQVSYLYQPYHPAILRLVKMVIDAAHREARWVGMCGEMAGDKVAIPLLVGLGLDEFSMSASSILGARAQIRKLKQKEMVLLAERALGMGTAEEVYQAVQAQVGHFITDY